MSVAKAAVVGAGTMGRDIAKVLAGAGVDVLLKDVDPALVEIGEEGVTGTTSYDGFGDVEFVIEAVPEVMELKHAVFAELDAVTPGNAVLASNTSCLSITEIGEATTRPDCVVGFHFFYPATMARLIEVVEGADTSEETVAAATRFAQQLRKTPIRCGEAPGFVVNRILTAASSEAWRMVDEEGVSPEEVDAAIKESGGPVGPVPPGRPAGAGHGPARGRAPARQLRRRALPRLGGHARAGAPGQPGREDREGLL